MKGQIGQGMGRLNESLQFVSKRFGLVSISGVSRAGGNEFQL